MIHGVHSSTALGPTQGKLRARALALPLLGASAGLAVHALRDDWIRLDRAPWRALAGIADQVAGWLGPWSLPAFVGAGLLLGAFLALAATDTDVTVTVDDAEVVLAHGSSVRSHRAEDVREALLDGGHLVLLAHDGTELARLRTRLPGERLAAAFRAHGYAWIGPEGR